MKIPHQASTDDLAQIRQLQKSQAAVYHCAYNLWKSGLDQNGVRAELKQRSFDPRMDSWFVQSMVNRAKGQVESDRTNQVKKRIFGGKK